MRETETEINLRQALGNFAHKPLYEGGLGLLDALDIQGRPLEPKGETLQSFLEVFPPGKPLTEREEELLKNNIHQIFFLRQWTGDNLQIPFNNENSFAHSILFIAVKLHYGEPDAALLKLLTRAINKFFANPAIVLFRQENRMALGHIPRRAHKKDSTQAVLGTATINRNINLHNPDSAHIKILLNLIPDTNAEFIKNDAELNVSLEKINVDALIENMRATLDDDDEKIARRRQNRTDFQAFIQKIKQYPLLSRGEEIELAQQIENGSEEAKTKFIKSNFRLVLWWAHKYIQSTQHLFLEDLFQEGTQGLIKAIERWDRQRGFKFSTYGSYWIRHNIIRAIDNKERFIRIPANRNILINKIKRAKNVLSSQHEGTPTLEELSIETELPIDTIKNALKPAPIVFFSEELVNANAKDSNPSPEQRAIEKDIKRQIRQAIHSLPKKFAQEVLKKRFGIDSREYTLKEIGRKYNLTRERIRQIQEKALKKLRHHPVLKRLRKL